MFEERKLKKEAKKRAEKRRDEESYVSEMLGREAEAKAWLRNSNVSYWCLNNTPVNHHAPIDVVADIPDDELNSLYWDFFLHRFMSVDKKESRQIRQELLGIVQDRKMSFQDLIQYVVNEAPEKYRVVLFLESDKFQKAIRHQGTWTDSGVMTTGKERKSALNDLNAVIRKMNIVNYADIIQFALHERPAEYVTLVFEHPRDVIKLMDKWNKKRAVKP